ncbi:unnamed protein product [Larinioides sclopetarius]|uniref:IMD domain-containing protein n=1 Tax=Larinioides sclopetarius TaxID=280406 RepID=A0AAV2BAG0_9ARAC
MLDMDADEIAKLVDGAYKNILEKFNPCARQLISAGKAYLKSLHGAVASSKTYLESISKLARHAHQATWGGSTDIDSSNFSCRRRISMKVTVNRFNQTENQ